MTNTKKCPHCADEINVDAKKCKHCGEWLIDKTETNTQNISADKDHESLGFGGSIKGAVIYAGAGWVLFHFGGWHIVWGGEIDAFFQYILTGEYDQKNIILNGNGFWFRINDKYFGFSRNGHFFDSPIIQWLMIGLSVAAFYCAIQMLIGLIMSANSKHESKKSEMNGASH